MTPDSPWRRHAWAAGLLLGPLIAAAAAVVSPVAGVAAALALIGGVLIAKKPLLGFFLTVMVIPLERIGRFTNDASVVTFSLVRVMGLVTLAALAAHTLLLRRRWKTGVPFFLYAAYIGFGVVSLGYATDLTSGIRTVGAVLGNLMFLFLVINMVDEWEQVKTAVAIWLTVSAAVAAFTTWQWHTDRGRLIDDAFASTGQRSTEDRFSTILVDAAEFETSRMMARAMGTTSHPAVYAINNILTFPFLVWFFVEVNRRWVKALIGAGLALVAYNVLLTNTRAALLAALAAGALCVICGLIRLRASHVAVAVALAFCAIPFIPPAIYERVLDPSNWSMEKSLTLRARLLYWQAGLESIGENPVAGIGLGNQAEIPKRLEGILPMPENSTVHNEYIQTVMELGFVGAALFALFLIVVYRRIRWAETAYDYAGEISPARFLTAVRVAFLSTLIYAVQVDVMHFPLKGWWLAMGLGLVLFEYAPAGIREARRDQPDFGAVAWSGAWNSR